MAKVPEFIDAMPILSRWYGPDSMACHRVRILSEREAESEFLVGQNLCGPTARPPMFNRLVLIDEVFSTQTGPEDARQHFIESAGISVVPGHNLVGLVAEAMALQQGLGREFWITGFDYVRFRNIVVPRQEISFGGTQGTFAMSGEKRQFTRNFRIEMEEELDGEARAKVLALHWLCEINAQGLGMVALTSAPEGMAPVLMEIGQSSFSKVRVLAGDTLRSCFTAVTVSQGHILGNAVTYLGDTVVASQQELLLGLYPVDVIQERIKHGSN